MFLSLCSTTATPAGLWTRHHFEPISSAPSWQARSKTVGRSSATWPLSRRASAALRSRNAIAQIDRLCCGTRGLSPVQLHQTNRPLRQVFARHNRLSARPGGQSANTRRVLTLAPAGLELHGSDRWVSCAAANAARRTSDCDAGCGTKIRPAKFSWWEVACVSLRGSFWD